MCEYHILRLFRRNIMITNTIARIYEIVITLKDTDKKNMAMTRQFCT